MEGIPYAFCPVTLSPYRSPVRLGEVFCFGDVFDRVAGRAGRVEEADAGRTALERWARHFGNDEDGQRPVVVA